MAVSPHFIVTLPRLLAARSSDFFPVRTQITRNQRSTGPRVFHVLLYLSLMYSVKTLCTPSSAPDFTNHLDARPHCRRGHRGPRSSPTRPGESAIAKEACQILRTCQNKSRILYSTFMVRFPDVSPPPLMLSFFSVVSITLLVSDSLAADRFHPLNTIMIKVVDWACVFSDEVGQFQFVPSHDQTYRRSGQVHLEK